MCDLGYKKGNVYTDVIFPVFFFLLRFIPLFRAIVLSSFYDKSEKKTCKLTYTKSFWRRFFEIEDNYVNNANPFSMKSNSNVRKRGLA